jgi:hypothetical protein
LQKISRNSTQFALAESRGDAYGQLIRISRLLGLRFARGSLKVADPQTTSSGGNGH